MKDDRVLSAENQETRMEPVSGGNVKTGIFLRGRALPKGPGLLPSYTEAGPHRLNIGVNPNGKRQPSLSARVHITKQPQHAFLLNSDSFPAQSASHTVRSGTRTEIRWLTRVYTASLFLPVACCRLCPRIEHVNGMCNAEI